MGLHVQLLGGTRLLRVKDTAKTSVWCFGQHPVPSGNFQVLKTYSLVAPQRRMVGIISGDYGSFQATPCVFPGKHSLDGQGTDES